MNRLAATLSVEDVLVDVEGVGRTGVFEKAGQLFESRHGIARDIVAGNLLARERLGSTGLGHGVAIPHGRIKGLKEPVAAILRLREPITFDAPDNVPVMLLVFLFVPESATQGHLEILSEIAEMLSDRALRDGMKTEGDAAALYRSIARWVPPGSTR